MNSPDIIKYYSDDSNQQQFQDSIDFEQEIPTDKLQENPFQKAFTESEYSFDFDQSNVLIENGSINNGNSRNETNNGEENQIFSQQWKKVKVSQKHRRPAETKNIPKTYARALQQHIKTLKESTGCENLQELLKKTEVEKFLNLNPEYISKSTLNDFLMTEVGKIIGQQAFGSLEWVYFLTKGGRINLNNYFRYNKPMLIQSLPINKKKIRSQQ